MHPEFPRVVHTLDCNGVMATRIRCSNMSNGTKFYLTDVKCNNCVSEKKAADTAVTPKSNLNIDNDLFGSVMDLKGLTFSSIAEEHSEETDTKLKKITHSVRKNLINVDKTGIHAPSKKNQAEMLRLQGIMRVKAGTDLRAQLDQSDKSMSDKMVGNKPRKVDSVLMGKDLGMEGKMVREFKQSFMSKTLNGTTTADDAEAVTKAFSEKEKACRAGLPPTPVEMETTITATAQPATTAQRVTKRYITQTMVEEEWVKLGKAERVIMKDEEYDFC